MNVVRLLRLYAMEEFLFRESAREKAKRAIEEHWRAYAMTIPIRLSGASMGDCIPQDAVAVVQFSRDPNPISGEMIYIRKGTQRIVHRFLCAVGPFVVEKGDANRHYGIHSRNAVLGTAAIVDASEISPTEARI